MSIVANIKNILIAFAILIVFAGGAYFWGTKSCTTIVDTVTITVPVIGPIKTDTISIKEIVEIPVPIDDIEYVVDSTYYYKYINEVVERNKLILFLEAIIINDTITTLVDNDTIKISVFSKMRGELIKQNAEYTIKARDIIVDISKTVPKYKLYIGTSVTLPLGNDNPDYLPVVGAGLFINGTKRDNIFNVMIHTNKSISVGYAFRVFKK